MTVVAWSDEGPADAPAVLFVHALGADRSMWDEQAAALAGEWRVLRLDLPGHGESPAGAATTSVGEYAAMALGLLDELGAAGAHLCGASLGGQVALSAALIAPGRVRSLILANTAARIGEPLLWNERIADIEERGLAATAPEIVSRWFAPGFAERAPHVVSRMTDRLAAMPQPDYIAGCLAVRDADLRPALASIDRPTLVIAGADDGPTPPEQSAALAAAMPRARATVIDGAGHFAAVEEPAAFLSALTSHLEEHP